MHIYIYIYREREIDSYVYVYIYIYIYTYTYIHTHNEGKRGDLWPCCPEYGRFPKSFFRCFLPDPGALNSCMHASPEKHYGFTVV